MSHKGEDMNNENGIPLNFMVALLIADEATKRLGVKHGVSSCGPYEESSEFRANLDDNEVEVDGQRTFDILSSSQHNWVHESARIVRKGDGWGPEVTMKGWEMCQEADRRENEGEDVWVRIHYVGKHNDCNWRRRFALPFQCKGGAFHVGVMAEYTVQWPADEWQDVTEETMRWYAEQVAVGLK